MQQTSTKKYKTWYDWVGKVIHWELCKWLNSNHRTKWYMQKLESVQEIELNEILWDFETQMDHPIPASSLDRVLIGKKKTKKKLTYCLMCFAVPMDRIEKQTLGSCQRTKKKSCGTWRWQWYQLWLVYLERSQKLGRKTEGIRNKRKNRDHSDYSFVKND